MVIGGLVGAGIWRLLVPVAPDMPVDPTPFVIVGMMALFGSIAHAPLAVMLMVAEMTGDLGMLAPAMISVGVAMLVVRDRSIYHSQLATQADSPAHRFRFAMPVLASVLAGDAARTPRLVLRPTESAGAALRRLEGAALPGAPVVEIDGTVRGSVMRAEVAAADPAAPVGTLASRQASVIAATDGLDDALGLLTDEHRDWAPVVRDGHLVGILSVGDVMAAYRRALAGNTRQVRGLEAGGVLLEGDLRAGSILIGSTVATAPWPRDTILIAVQRSNRLIVPRGDVLLAVGDRLSVFAAPDAEAATRALLDLKEEASGIPAAEQPAR